MKFKNYPTRNFSQKVILPFLLLFAFQFANSQNTCAEALPITFGSFTVDAVNGTQIPLPVCTLNGTGASAGEWYSFTPSENISVTVTTDLAINNCKDTRFQIYTGTCTSLVCFGGDDDAGVLGCNGNGNSYLSKDTFDAVAGTTYYIAFDNKWQSSGFEFQIIENIPLPNLCDSAINTTSGITTVDAISDLSYSTTCSSASLAKWYSFTPAVTSMLTITSDLQQNICKDTNFSVYRGTCPNGLICVTSDDNSGSIACNSGNTNSFLSKKTFEVTGGTTYYIVWDNKWSAAGFDFQITEVPIIVPVSYTTQTYPSINSGYDICIVDLNGDGKDDVAGVSNGNLRVHYQGNTGITTPTDIPFTGATRLPNWSMAAGDYNRDGFNDIVLGNGSGVSILTSNTTGTGYTGITPSQYIFCQRTNFADLNNDGNLDIFSCHDIAPNVYYLNDGSGNLTHYQTGVTPGAMNLGDNGGNYATLFTDFDNDNDTDVFISKCSGPPCELLRNDGGGVYTNVSAFAGINITPIQTWSSGVADFDNDDDMDIIITASAGQHHFFKNNLDTTNTIDENFTEITLGSGWDTNGSTNIDNVAYDFDNDGLVDVLGGGNKIMFNQGNNFFSPTNYPAIGIGAVGDLNSDGFLDIQNGNEIHYAIPNGNNWLKVGLKGTLSNANGIGARIEIYGAFGKKIRDVRSGEGFRYMSSINAHFGIGQATAIAKIIVKWPSGKVDEILNPAINQFIVITENETNLQSNSIETSAFTLYPNPASDILNITTKEKIEIRSAQITDLTGRLISDSKISNNTINIKDLATGTYILVIKNTEGKQFSEKFIKK